MTESEALMEEVLRLRALLRKAADQLQVHNEEYRHRTPAEFIAELRAAAPGVTVPNHDPK
jgi:hypothetical protein